MSQRTEKVESLVKQTVATALAENLDKSAALVTVTAVDVSPDLKGAIVWLGIVAAEPKRQKLFEEATAARPQLQAAVAKIMTTKYIPRLELRLDAGGDYAQHISEIIREL